MRSQLFRWLLTATLAGGTLASVTTASAQPDVRDHRKGPKRLPNQDRPGAPPVNAGPPREAPPPPKEERIAKRRGFVWINGYWDWRGGQYVWVAGHWDREQRGKRWRGHHWEHKGDQWVRVDGSWEVDAPTAAPPAPKEEKWEPRTGFVWVRGAWDWQNGEWVWVPGHWDRARAGKMWREPKWELQGGVWVQVAGDWIDAPKYPTAAPPAPRDEKIGTRAGFIWVKGRWDCSGGSDLAPLDVFLVVGV